MNLKSYVITWTPRSNKHSLRHKLDLDISIAKDTQIQIHGWLDYNLIWSLDTLYLFQNKFCWIHRYTIYFVGYVVIDFFYTGCLKKTAHAYNFAIDDPNEKKITGNEMTKN
jgi:hypothetical protein